MRFHQLTLALAAAGLLTLTGCASTANPQLLQDRQAENLKLAQRTLQAEPAQARILNVPYIDTTPVPYRPDLGDTVTINAAGAAVGGLIQGLAERIGYSVMFSADTDPAKEISLNVSNTNRKEAIRMAALAAGFVALIQDDNRQIVIAKRGTYTFKLPTDLFDSTRATYSVGGNPAASGGSPGGGSGGMMGGMGSGMGGMGGGSAASGGSGGQSMQASFVVSGSSGGLGTENFLANVRELAGEGAVVSLNAITGLLSVTAGPAHLIRVKNFVENYAQDALKQVEIQATIAEVSLSDGQQFGIDWSKIVPIAGGGTVQIGINNTSGISGTPNLTTTVTTASISSVIKALEQQSNVRVLAQPRLLAINHTPAVLFDGQQQPYLGNITSTTTGTVGATSTGSALSFVLNGVSLSFQPHILDNQTVSLKVVPVLSDVARFNQFQVNGNTLTGPEQLLRQVYMQVLAQNGKTVILGGTHQASNALSQNGVPVLDRIPLLGKLFTGINDNGRHKELVMLVSTRVVPAPQHQTLVGESL